MSVLPTLFSWVFTYQNAVQLIKTPSKVRGISNEINIIVISLVLVSVNIVNSQLTMDILTLGNANYAGKIGDTHPTSFMGM